MNTPPTADIVAQLSELANSHAELSALKAQMSAMKTHVLTVPRSGMPEVHTFDTPAEAAEHMVSLIGQEVQVFVFMGHRLSVTRGPNRYLVGPGIKLPLFADRDDDIDPDGWMVDTPAESLPVSLPPPTQVA